MAFKIILNLFATSFTTFTMSIHVANLCRVKSEYCGSGIKLNVPSLDTKQVMVNEILGGKFGKIQQQLKIDRIQTESISERTVPEDWRPSEIRVSVPHIPSRIRTQESEEQKKNRIQLKGGLYKYVLEAFAQAWNVTVVPIPATGGGTGLPIGNSTKWNGVIGDLLEEKADVGIITAITYSRIRVVDFTHAVEFQEMAFVVSNPARFYTWKTIFWPFQASFWMLIGASATFVVITLSRMPERNRIWISWSRIGLAKSFTFVLTGLMEQGVPLPGNRNARIVCILWLMLTLNVCLMYKSRFFAILTIPIKESAPVTFEQLADSDYKYGLYFVGGAAYHLIKTSKNPSLVKIVNKRLERVSGPTKCYENVLNLRKYACIAWGGTIDYVVSSNFSDSFGNGPFLVSKRPAFVVPLAFSIRKGSLLIRSLNSFILRANAGGLVQAWTNMDIDHVRMEGNEWRRRNNSTTGSNFSFNWMEAGGKVSILSLSHLRGCFALWVVGILTALVSIIIENLLAACRKCSRREGFLVAKLGTIFSLPAIS